MSILQRDLMISQYFTKVKALCEKIIKLDPENPISDSCTRKIIIHRLKQEFNGLVTATRGWITQLTFMKLESILMNQKALDKQISRVSSR